MIVKRTLKGCLAILSLRLSHAHEAKMDTVDHRQTYFTDAISGFRLVVLCELCAEKRSGCANRYQEHLTLLRPTCQVGWR
jgi:hypothetical protein